MDVFAVITAFWDTLMTNDETKKNCGRKSTILKRSKKFQVDSSKKMALGTNGLSEIVPLTP